MSQLLKWVICDSFSAAESFEDSEVRVVLGKDSNTGRFNKFAVWDVDDLKLVEPAYTVHEGLVVHVDSFEAQVLEVRCHSSHLGDEMVWDPVVIL